MFLSRKSLLLPLVLMSIPTAALADGMADRHNESNVQQSMDTVEEVYEMYGPTAAGPAEKEAVMVNDVDTRKANALGSIEFPPDVTTAHERKRYIFDSEKF